MNFFEDQEKSKSFQNEFESSQCFSSPEDGKKNFNPNDSNLELLDPTPSIHDLFVRFDQNFFWGSLGMVQVLWSNRMTKCAGMCYFEGKYGLCKISLSAPLLSLRPRKDLVETLLHEMIHAYLFVTNNYKDREDHGPEFRKHMYRINNKAGTNISVYHTFHDEVEYYQRHIWRCDGPCRFKRPYFGFVKRSMNRAPGPNDTWWNQHKIECNGTFIKVSEPEKKIKKPNKTKSNRKDTNFNSKDIRDLLSFTSKSAKNQGDATITTGLKDLKTDIAIHNDLSGSEYLKVKNIPPEFNEKFIEHRIISDMVKKEKLFDNVKTKKDGKESKSSCMDSILTSGKENVSSEKQLLDSNSMTARDFVRSIWSKRYSSGSNNIELDAKYTKTDVPISSKLSRTEEISGVLKHEQNAIINSDSGGKSSETFRMCPACGKNINSEEMNDHLDNCLHSVVINENDSKINNKLVPCPCCYQLFSEFNMDFHIDECLTKIALKQEMLNL